MPAISTTVSLVILSGFGLAFAAILIGFTVAAVLNARRGPGTRQIRPPAGVTLREVPNPFRDL